MSNYQLVKKYSVPWHYITNHIIQTNMGYLLHLNKMQAC